MKIKAVLLNSIKRLKTNNFLLFPVFLALAINQPSFSMNYFWENNSFWNNNSNTTKQEDNSQFYSQKELDSQPSELFSQECLKNKNTQNNKNKPENKTLSNFLENCKNNINILQSFFSPKDDILSIITYLINNEKMYIRIAAYMLRSREIIRAIVNASKRDIIIEIILNTADIELNTKQIQYLKDNGVKIFFTDNKILMHNKFIVFTQNINKNKLVLTGSYNFTYKAQTNYENVIISNDSQTIRQYYDEFNSIKNKCSLPLYTPTTLALRANGK